MALFTTVIPSFMISDGIKKIGSGNASIIGSIDMLPRLSWQMYFLTSRLVFGK
jgi:hypothetical protein